MKKLVLYVLLPLVGLALVLALVNWLFFAKFEQKRMFLEEETAAYKIDICYSDFQSDRWSVDKDFAVLDTFMARRVRELVKTFKQESEELQAMLDSMPAPRPEWKSELYIRDSVFFCARHFVSVRLTIYEFHGGAHGITTYEAMNFDVKSKSLLPVDQILDMKKEWHINELMERYFLNPDRCFDGHPSMELLPVVNVGPRGVHFLFPQYVLGPYSCGAAEIYVPSTGILRSL